MTTSQVLRAGRELDALVAEKVMEWTEVGMGVDLAGRVNGPYGVDPATKRGKSGSLEDQILESRRFDEVPVYSTDIAAAWTVVEKLVDLYENCQFTMKYRQGYDPDFWLVGWQVRRESGWQWSDAFGKGEAPTLPLAICRLAVQQ